MFISALLFIVAYFLGSIPTGYLAGRYLQGIDIREHGSGSTGATNVLRTLGKPAAIAVLIIDILKGALSLLLVNLVFSQVSSDILPASWYPWVITVAAIGAIIGHSKSIWLNFSGGKSVATTLGVLLVMNPWLALGTLGTFLIVLAISRIVSLSSISGAIAVNLVAIALHLPLPYCIFAGIAGIYVIIRHKSNIQRLLAGTEPKIGQTLTENT
ncbi:MAG: glycerol-3-phosphate 1-O-acyltransferase PlsY [Pleurocapsa sp.]